MATNDWNTQNAQSSQAGLAVLEGCYLGERPKRLLELAKAKNILSSNITTPCGEKYPATQYCVMLYYNAVAIESSQEVFKTCFPEVFTQNEEKQKEFQDMMQEAFQMICLMLTMERMRKSTWSFGAELRYEMAAVGLVPTTQEAKAFYAQQGAISAKGEAADIESLMYHNPLAVLIYASDVLTNHGTLRGQLLPSVEMPKELYEMFTACWKPTCKDSLNAMLTTFCPSFLGDQQGKLGKFMEYLENNRFFTAPASLKNSCFSGGLAVHASQVLARLVGFVKPQTTEEVGKLVLLAVGHCLGSINRYVSYITEKVIDGPAMKAAADGTATVDKARTKCWANGAPYHYREVMEYKIADKFPVGYSAKSLHCLLFYFTAKITEEMAAAIDGFTRDVESNPNCEYQLRKYPMCQYLHVADMMARMLDEEGGAAQ